MLKDLAWIRSNDQPNLKKAVENGPFNRRSRQRERWTMRSPLWFTSPFRRFPIRTRHRPPNRRRSCAPGLNSVTLSLVSMGDHDRVARHATTSRINGARAPKSNATSLGGGDNTAVDGDGLADDVRTGARGKKNGQAGNVFRRPDPSPWVCFADAVPIYAFGFSAKTYSG